MRLTRIGAISAMLLAAGGCQSAPESQRAYLRASLNGIQEIPGPGDADGNGTAEIRVNSRAGEVCWTLAARQIDPATAAHIHRGAAGTAGPPVVTLTTPDASGRSQGCAAVDPGLAREIAMRGHDFYVNVHNAAYPAGAIRGQLRGGPMPRERAGRGVGTSRRN